VLYAVSIFREGAWSKIDGGGARDGEFGAQLGGAPSSAGTVRFGKSVRA
jgi:hypothetical protein